MNLAVVLKAGASGALFAVGSITATFIFGYFLGKWLKIPIEASALISAGTAICGEKIPDFLEKSRILAFRVSLKKSYFKQYPPTILD